MHIFYVSDAQPPLVTLDESESGHAIRVLRLKSGDRVCIVNGMGSRMEGTIESENPRKCQIRTSGALLVEDLPVNPITLVIAPTKNIDRMEWLVEKATEIGIYGFEFILCRYSERKQINIERLRKVAISGMKQSGRATLPILSDMVPVLDWIAQPFAGDTFIAHCYPGDKPHLFHKLQSGRSVRVMIGPEGDFSPDEVKIALQSGFSEVTLGESRLRTETAALAACHAASLANLPIWYK